MRTGEREEEIIQRPGGMRAGHYVLNGLSLASKSPSDWTTPLGASPPAKAAALCTSTFR